MVQLREFAAKNKWDVFREYTDYESGSKADRVEFQRMFADASKRRFDLVLFWALDCLSREGVLETLTHLNRLTACGVDYKSYTEQYFDSCGIFRTWLFPLLRLSPNRNASNGANARRQDWHWPLRVARF